MRNELKMCRSRKPWPTASMTVTDENGDEQELEITGTYQRAERGRRERGSGVQLEPDYPAHFDDISATLNGKPYELTDEEMTRAAEELWESNKED